MKNASAAVTSWLPGFLARYGGTILTLALAILLQLLANSPLRIPNPPAFLVLAIVFSAFTGGIRPGVISALIAWVYIAYFFSLSDQPFQYTDDNLRRVIVWAGVMPLIAVMVGYLNRRTAQALADVKLAVLRQAQLEEQVRADEALRLSQERYRTLVEQASDGIFVADTQGHYVDVNTRGCEMLGYTHEEMLQLSIADLIPTEDLTVKPIPFDDLRAGKTLVNERRLKRKDGSLLFTEVSAKILPDGRLQGIVRDITERKRAEEESRANLWLLENLDRINQSIQGANDLQKMMVEVLDALLTIFECDRAWLVYPCDPNAATWQVSMERTRPEYPGILPIGVELPLDPPGAVIFQILRDSPTPVQFGPDVEHPVPTGIAQGLGVQAFIAMAIYPKVDKPWSFGLHQCSHPRFWKPIEERLFQEIGRRLADGLSSLLAYRQLQESEDLYRLLTENSNDLIYLLDLGGRFTYASPSVVRLLGYDPVQLGNISQFERIHPDDFKEAQRAWGQVAAGKQTFFTVRFMHPDGGVRWLEVAASLIRYRGKPHVFGIGRDMTGRKQAEEALRQAHQDYVTLVNSIDGIVWEADADTFVFNFVSGQAERLLGYPTERWLTEATFWKDHIHPDDQGWAVDFCVQSTQQKRPHDFEYRMIAADGRTVWLRDIVTVVVENGKPSRLRGIMIDTTERKRAEENLHHSLAELEAVARVSAALRTAQTLDEMLPILLDETLTALVSPAGIILLYYPGEDELRAAVARGWFETLKESSVKPGEGIAGTVFATGQVHLTREFISDPLTRQTAIENIPIGWGGICVPIRTAAQVEGVLFVAVPLPREITPEESKLLFSLAEIAGTALHRLRLYEETTRRLEHVQALHIIDRAINASPDLRITLEVLLKQVSTHLGVDAAGVLLFKPESLTLEYAAGRGFRTQNYEYTRLPLGVGITGRAALEHQMVQVSTQLEAPEFVRASLLKDEGFVVYAAMPFVAKGELKGVLEIFHRIPLRVNAEWYDFLETLAHQTAIAIDNAQLFEGLQRSNAELRLAYDATIEGWSRALDLRDKETEGHTQRVTGITLRLAQAAGINEDKLIHMRRGALLHDIGKMGIPDSILLKPDVLTETEWAVMRQHPTYAYELLSPIAHLHPALDIPYCHHEKWDGSGYPRGLKGEEIPLAARLFTVVDVWDALRSDRPYRPAWPEDKVRAYIRAQAGKHFDPKTVDLFLQMIGADMH